MLLLRAVDDPLKTSYDMVIWKKLSVLVKWKLEEEFGWELISTNRTNKKKKKKTFKKWKANWFVKELGKEIFLSFCLFDLSLSSVEKGGTLEEERQPCLF